MTQWPEAVQDALFGGESRVPMSPAELMALGAQLHGEGRLELALAVFERCVSMVPDLISGWHAFTALRLALKRPAAALTAANRALELAPERNDSLFNVAIVLAELGDQPAAIHAYRRILARDDTHYGALLNLMPLLLGAGELDAAIALGQHAVLAHPQSADMQFNLGEALTSASRHGEARAAYSESLRLAPDMVKADIAIAVSEAAQGELLRSTARLTRISADAPQALAHFSSPLVTDRFSGSTTLDPGRVALIAAYERYRRCDWSATPGLADLFERVTKGVDCPPLASRDLPFLGIGLALSGASRLQAARQVATQISAETTGKRLVRPLRKAADGRLRIGYVSGDFRQHATGYLCRQLFAAHDRNRFTVTAYSLTGQPDDEIGSSIKSGCDQFVDAARFDALALAQRIALDQIDILVDLAGYTLHARPAAFTYRPAPIQVSYLAYLQTMGADWIDYALLDRHVLTAAERPFWQERIATLPDTLYICDEAMGGDIEPADRQQFGIPEQALVFCCLNAPWKIGVDDFALWMEILASVPDSVLLLLADHPAVTANLSAAATRAGIAPERLIFTGPLPLRAHLQRYTVADLFLDTQGCNAHTTAIEALSVGLPVLTRPGATVPSRVAAGLLRAHGLPELVAASDREYVDKALHFARDGDWRAKLRAAAANRQASRLFCTAQRVREIEVAYEGMWARHQAGLAPADFAVAPSGGDN